MAYDEESMTMYTNELKIFKKIDSDYDFVCFPQTFAFMNDFLNFMWSKSCKNRCGMIDTRQSYNKCQATNNLESLI